MKPETTHMTDLRLQTLSGCARPAIVSFAIAALCATGATFPALAQPTPQKTFPSAMAAGKGLFQAVQSDNIESIANILGGPTELAQSGDESQDKLDRERFVQKYQEMHRMVREPNGTLMLYIGAENWPFPIPLVEKDGAWRFDADTGMKEVLYRRIGGNELTAIAVCHDFAAQRRNGATAAAANPPNGFAASLAAKASGAPAAGDPVLFHGYYFRAASIRPGGFALIAYPAEYRSSGVMTFVVTAKDVVYEKDMGANSTSMAGAMTAFHKDATWRVSGN